MMILADLPPIPVPASTLLIISSVLFVGTFAAALLGLRPLKQFILEREALYDKVLRGSLLLDVRPRSVTVLNAFLVAVLGAIGYLATESLLGMAMLGFLGIFAPKAIMKILRQRRLAKLEDQLVAGIQTLASGVRAGLNLVQSMELVARDGPIPLRQEFGHLLREYEFGLPLEEAMHHAASRIGSGDFRLLFAALHTHRERGGDLGETLDRIAESIREIQRLENRVKTLTAQGRATARWLGAMPAIVLLIIYFLVNAEDVKNLFIDDLGKLILLGIVVLNVLGFMWIRKIMAIDI
ncbi:MAG: Bacterial type II secretion system protein F domain protein [Planctomycetes bacterium ADurb.Bin126]|nr:MAG: Bacterial type II secretion system protein F domain protein [Planctomycetes bacterium ADurb.Bin126]HOD81700.1 type II secretion system F family protein [Phycisphaerae bacterium]HQL76118.1 type II secretion system F family protein [Phycisphaerae bacterium]